MQHVMRVGGRTEIVGSGFDIFGLVLVYSAAGSAEQRAGRIYQFRGRGKNRICGGLLNLKLLSAEPCPPYLPTRGDAEHFQFFFSVLFVPALCRCSPLGTVIFPPFAVSQDLTHPGCKARQQILLRKDLTHLGHTVRTHVVYFLLTSLRASRQAHSEPAHVFNTDFASRFPPLTHS